MSEETLIRKTRSVCPVCIEEIPAMVVERDSKVFLSKECPDHGACDVLLSCHPWYHAGLDRYYFSVMDESFIQRDYLVRLTERCNLKCPICLASANMSQTPEYPLQRLAEFMRGKRKLKIDLISAEPTVREDLPEIIREVKKAGHIVALHTNGIRLADFEYAKHLKSLGVDEVHLQMDGFSDEAYEKIRGRKLLENKMQVLENIEKLNLATDLVMTIVPGVNELEISKMLEYCRDKPFIKELFFLGCRSLGYAREKAHDICLMPDEVIDLVEEQSKGKINRRSIYRFQKLYFAFLSLLGVRKCFYVQHYLLIREKGGYTSAEELFDWESIEKHLDRLSRIPRKNAIGRLLWLFGLVMRMANRKFLRLFFDFLSLKIRLMVGFDLSKIPSRTLVLGFITACDPFIFDTAIAQNCGKGELSMDVGREESGAVANIKRERIWLEESRKAAGCGAGIPPAKDGARSGGGIE